MKIRLNKILLFPIIYFLSGLISLAAQHKFCHDWDRPMDFSFQSTKQDGFQASLSLVAMFTTGVADRSGFRLGAGLSISYTQNKWTATSGVDFYKATQNLGLGTSFAGISFFDGRYGASYFLNHYYQHNSQTSGIIGLSIKDFSIRFEDDILAYPFVGFRIYDRYRTAALELRYKGFMFGTNVYTTDINGQTIFDNDNKKGAYRSGKQISSPVYLGYTNREMFIRLGLNNSMGGKLGQNLWHKYLFDTPNFNTGDYSNKFMQIGIDKPYSLY